MKFSARRDKASSRGKKKGNAVLKRRELLRICVRKGARRIGRSEFLKEETPRSVIDHAIFFTSLFSSTYTVKYYSCLCPRGERQNPTVSSCFLEDRRRGTSKRGAVNIAVAIKGRPDPFPSPC